MTRPQNTVASAVRSKILNGISSPFGRPTDIIGFQELGRLIADEICSIIGEKEICFFDEHVKNDKKYHYLDFSDMLEKSEIMIFTTELPEKYFDVLGTLNRNVKIIISSKLTKTIQTLINNGYKENLLIYDLASESENGLKSK